jgi:hypothetical protein
MPDPRGDSPKRPVLRDADERRHQRADRPVQNCKEEKMAVVQNCEAPALLAFWAALSCADGKHPAAVTDQETPRQWISE